MGRTASIPIKTKPTEPRLQWIVNYPINYLEHGPELVV